VKKQKKKNPKNVLLGRRSRNKGKVWERLVARDLREFWGDSVYRGHQDARGGAAAGEGADIEGTSFYVECRHEKTYDWRKHLRETLAKRTERNDTRPVLLVAKEDLKPAGWKVGSPGTPPIVVMLYDELLILLDELQAFRNEREAAECVTQKS